MRRFLLLSSAFLVLGIVPLFPSSAMEKPPREVLQTFCESDAQGKRLTPEGRKELAELFTQPDSASLGHIIIVRDFVVSPPALTQSRAEFYVEYIYLAQLDPMTLRLSRVPGQPSTPVKVRDGFNLVLKANSTGSAQSARTTESGWLILGAPPTPHITPATAIRYVTELRDRTQDELIRKNANETVRSLRRYVK
jgi:hypothetical protein